MRKRDAIILSCFSFFLVACNNEHELLTDYDNYKPYFEEMREDFDAVEIKQLGKINFKKLDLRDYLLEPGRSKVTFSAKNEGDFNGIDSYEWTSLLTTMEQNSSKNSVVLTNYSKAYDSFGEEIAEETMSTVEYSLDSDQKDVLKGLSTSIFGEQLNTYLSKEPWESSDIISFIDEHYYSLEDESEAHDMCILVREFPVEQSDYPIVGVTETYHCPNEGNVLSILRTDDVNINFRNLSLDLFTTEQLAKLSVLETSEGGQIIEEGSNIETNENNNELNNQRNLVTNHFSTSFPYVDHEKFELKEYDLGNAEYAYEFVYLSNTVNEELFTIFIERSSNYPGDADSYFDEKGYQEDATYHILYRDELFIHYLVQPLKEFMTDDPTELEEMSMMALSSYDVVEDYLVIHE